MRTKLHTALFGSALLIAVPAVAHHSFAMFEAEKEITLDGTIEGVDWTNPHIWFYVMVPQPNGTADKWGVEAGATNSMMRFGWKRNTLKPGDKVSVVVRPMKDGTHAGSLRRVTMTDTGQTFVRDTEGARPQGLVGAGQ
jgi:hypothetical protein